MDAPVRPAAGVILVREAPPGLEVYLLHRNGRTAFLPGFHCFPGGAADEEDARLPVARPADDPTLVGAAARELFEETGVLLDAIRALGPGVEDPLADPATLARAVKIGLLDAPQLVNNRFAPGAIRTRSVDGAIKAVDEQGNPLSERERIERVLARAQEAETA